MACDCDFQILMRRRDAGASLSVSESQVLKFERLGWLTPVKIPGVRAVRYSADEVRALAKRWIDQAQGGSK